jgi:transmembrane sensor
MANLSPRIITLIDAFLKHEATDQQLRELQDWLEKDSANVRYFKKANEDFYAQSILKNGDTKKTEAAWAKLADKMGEHEAAKDHVVTLYPYRLLRIAASVTILAVATFFLWKKLEPASAARSGANMLVFHSNEKNSQLMLPDSSWVWLNANSSIEYAADFSIERQVRLKGEAFFDVRKKQAKNFTVITENLSIQVKGTRFNVRAYDSKNENATLEEGKIELTVKGDMQTYSLSPGDHIAINQANQKIVLKKVNPANFSAWKEEQLIFDNALLEDIIAKLENRYRVNIVIEESIAKRERLTMTINAEPIEDILEMIQLSSRLNYRIEKDHILIYE